MVNKVGGKINNLAKPADFDFKQYLSRISEKKYLTITEDNGKDYAEFHLKKDNQSSWPDRMWIGTAWSETNYCCEAEGSLKVDNENGNIDISYELWLSKRYMRNQKMIQGTTYLTILIMFVIALWLVRDADLIIILLLVIMVILILLLAIWLFQGGGLIVYGSWRKDPSLTDMIPHYEQINKIGLQNQKAKLEHLLSEKDRGWLE